jgi:type I restriction enzyme, S subunit
MISNQLSTVNSQVPQTEATVISQDWKVINLGRFMSLQRGYDLPHRERKAGDVPIITSSGFGETHSEAKVIGPGVVTGRYGTIGDVFYVQENFWPLNTTLYVKDFHGNDPLFSSYLLKTIDFHTHSGKSGVPGVNRNDLHEIRVHVPPTNKEQKKIAQALSDTDALIGSLEQLIAKKRHIKQGAMQELLIGKRRLAGFGEKKGYKKTEIGIIPEDWQFVTIGTLIKSLDAGVSVNSVDQEKENLTLKKSILKTSCVFGGIFFPNEKKRISPHDISRAKLNPRKGSIVISRMNTPALVGECGYIDNDYLNLFLPDRLWMTRPEENTSYCSRWLSYLLSFSSFNRAIKDSATGTSGSMKNISKGSFFAVKILLPIEKEQTAIATILSDMDTAISTLEEKLTKTRQLKQGMMHQLLTGKIRLLEGAR